MTVERYTRLFFGIMVLISLAFGAQDSPLYFSSYFLWLAVFIGANLVQFSFTNQCPLAIILRKLGVPETDASCRMSTKSAQ